jgi:ABC-type multidrug transport system ATPase subunit
MSETVLNALVQLFALIGDIHDETVITSREKALVRTFLSRHLNNEMVAKYMKMFEKYLELYNSESIIKDSIKDRKRVSLNAMRILAICEKINEELQQKQKIYVLIQLMDFISLGEEITENETDFVQTVASAFNVPGKEFENIKAFIMNNVYEVREKNRILVIDDKKESGASEIKHIREENIRGNVSFLYIVSTNTYLLRYEGNEDLYLNGQNIFAGQTYIFDHGSTIRGSGIKTIYYSEISSCISEATFKIRTSLDANDVSFKFRNSDNGIHNLNFHGESGELIGILGGSGVGKSTTLSILNGTLRPQSGEVLINGYNVYDENEKVNLKGVIGFVPQDDLLIEDLTVYQNIYFNAKMCLNNLTEDQIVEEVNRVLVDFDLEETKDLKVGNPLKKVISGGQRKRINIALELLREPTILYVDEPTSGLSSVDSEVVMNLLKEQTYKGKLVIINIHQPASGIYKMFDKIMIIDKGGYQVFFGNPTEAIIYLRTMSKHANPDEDQCVKCGNVDTDQILQIVEAKVVNEQGKATRIRKITPKEWADKFREKSGIKVQNTASGKQPLPENNFSIPGLLEQSKIFFTRDLLSKLADKQYILISLLGSPLLALLLAYFTRSGSGKLYRFIDNENIPAYIFMCVITSLFFGLMGSSEEIIKDKKILKRESFLHLSWFSYLNSKVLMMFILSAIQTLLFVLIGNLILGIRGMTFYYWLVLFTTSCSANILGLNISSAFNSVITIYILIPFIIIPQLLFSGVLVKFDKLHIKSNYASEFVPVIGDLMVARWSFEALAVKQFRDNRYEKPLFKYETGINLINNYKNIVDKLLSYLEQYDSYMDSVRSGRESNIDRKTLEENFTRLNYHIAEFSKLTNDIPEQLKSGLNLKNLNPEVEVTGKFLKSLRRCFEDELKAKTDLKDTALAAIEGKIGGKALADNRESYENRELRRMVLDERIIDLTPETPDKLLMKQNPGYLKPVSKIGRAHFFAPVKILGSREIDTYKFNQAVIWIVTLLLYLALYFNLLRKFIDYLESLRLPKTEI